MRVLIVDDNPRRYERLLAKLVDIGLDREKVSIVTSAMDARRSLSTKYDLMIVDILLPLRPEGLPEERHSRELLAEIIETEELQKPGYIVGLTAYPDAANKVTPFFRDNLWTIIGYSDQSDDWIQQIVNCVRYMDAEAASPAPVTHKVDVAVICALPDPELRAVLALDWNWTAARPLDDVTFVHDGKITFDGGSPLSVVAAAPNRMGMVSTALLASKLIERLRPRYLIMTGICAGVRGKANLGDAILADPSWDYQSGKRVEGEDGGSSFAMAPHQLPLATGVRSRFEQLRGDKDLLSSISNRWAGPVEHTLKLIPGPMGSGSAVLADVNAMSEVQQQHRELCGVEMEVYGLYSAAANASFPRPIAFAVKSVCDFGESDKNDNAQRYAAFTSAAVMDTFLRRYSRELNPANCT